MDRLETRVGRLARLGFAEAGRAEKLLSAWPHGADACIDLLADAADPDLALTGLHRLVEEDPDLPERMTDDPDLARRLIQVLGASLGLQLHLIRFPGDIGELAGRLERTPAAALRADLLSAVGADEGAVAPVADRLSGDELRIAYHRALLRIAARDLCATDPSAVQPSVSAELADLADAVLESALAIGRGEIGAEESARIRLAVIALGKTGARELNYVSDVDVLYVVEPVCDAAGAPLVGGDALATLGTKLASALQRVCSAHSGVGTIWPVDAALRPEGKAGPLVRTLASHRTYYQKWAKAWEFQAMLKARPAAGDLPLGQAFVDLVAPMVWQVGGREGFVHEVQAMRKRVVRLIPAKEQGRQIKLGEGGLRDTEFTVQLLELVHGRVDDRVRQAGTLSGLEALVEHGYVGREDGAEMAAAYRFQRTMEHRVQLYKLRRTHLIPEDEADLRRLGRSLGFRRNPAEEVVRAWRESTRQVIGLHQRVFYSPLLEAVSRIATEELRLTADEAEDRLRGLGYADPRAALAHLAALTQGMTRQAEIQRQILPAMLGWFADGPNPDAGLLAFRKVSEGLGRTSWYLRALRDRGATAERLALILSTSRYATDMLLRSPQSVQMLADEAEELPRPLEKLVADFTATALRHDDARSAADAIRALRRAELLRVSMADILHRIDVEDVGDALSTVAAATLEATLQVVAREAAERGEPLPAIAVMAMGRWGGGEMSYASDADCMFVMEDTDDPELQRRAIAAITRLREVLRRPGADPALEIDADLRPEGKGGPMVRSLESFRAYYHRWSSTWEAQALVRCAVGAGDLALGERLLAEIAPLRWPEGGLTEAQVREIRRLKARMEAERLPRGVERSRHTKLGPGGLSDVEWVVQLIQLQHAYEHPELRTTRTLPALRAERDLGLISAADAAVLEEAWLLASRIRNVIMLVRGRASDTLPTDGADAAAVAATMGFEGSGPLKAHYGEVTHRARGVVERLFWGD
ncbi:bifunctional [glutamine synthetase] adenylyltransferase/[glutamine synthetase]-adenylyl-L-tyrosine phosphorylase [Raineyella sp. LH-20]|uniref:bifunctional [glutamine synthetase] adenylyltransferase/[glutamine synthetase]-adenylyl-L-tyrosine phosphorylase n=1 Tax=Raineyella sp. LH-20 TaxID=3081204 RepID=UPI002953E551|nr:bifunctional [glutamine synthetase] adenylyltransferase/[glutamine synthetase]-adenylyl-L-tyrosine phosphorylase [Raineyella sp. LH-20]WOP17578.1 bifunctional [glutamine synthetase] adenylyltransferase/[glutamine synthetase]-adenylyl-L-tyrosine phosphorylase [Raineyella sp. LH-20]